jgi:uncharacterized protein (TIGR03000 family)
MRRTSILTAVIGLGLTATPANAQFYGPFYRPFGPYSGYLGYYPGAYQNSWSNGFSLYGPPVPTYGSVPGQFGGMNYRLNNNIQIYNGASIGLGGSGAGGAGPRRRHWQTNAGASMMPQLQSATSQALIEVVVPSESAIVFFEDSQMQQRGKVRQFASPPLPVGQTYFYKIRAKWMVEGETMEREKSVGVRANEKIVVDFTQPDPPAGFAQPGNG